jgi:hypothetical protein
MAFPQLGPRYVSLLALRVRPYKDTETATSRLSPRHARHARALAVVTTACGLRYDHGCLTVVPITRLLDYWTGRL